MSSSVSTPKTNKMPAQKKTVAAPAPVTTPAVVVETPKKTRKAAAAPASETTPAVEVAVPATTTEVRSAEAILTGLQESLRTLQADMSSRVRAAVHEAQEAVRALKREARDSKRRRRVDPATLSVEERAAWEARRANNAFLKVRPISDELTTFMGLPAKTLKSQTDVTKFVSTYIKAHNCFDPNFKRRILPDAKLAKLLRVKDSDVVTYLNLQSFLKVHFLKPTA
jgi:chromatin remodeling complex protein RSC6